MVLRSILALLPPFVALIFQLALRPVIGPHYWFLFYPAVFLSSWIGGLRAGILASAISIVAVLWVFIAHASPFATSTGEYFAAAVLLATGVLFGVFHDRLRRANRRTASALAASQRANHTLKEVANERLIFSALIENSSDFIGIADPTGKPVYVNPAGRKMVGLAADQPIENTTIADYYPADQRAFASEVIVRSMIDHGHWQGETRFRNWQTEESIPVSDTHFMVRDPKTAEIIGMGTVTRDISDIEQARAEAERVRRQLEKTSEAITALIEQAPEGFFVADLDGRYIDVNSAGCRMLGYTRKELIGKRITDVIPADEAARLEREKTQLLGGQVSVSEWTLRRKDGTQVSAEVSARILSDGRWQAIVRDVGARKQLEEALRTSHADLNLAQSVAKVGSWRLDVRRDELTWSDESYEIFGVPRGTATTYGAFMACVHPDDVVYVDRMWKAALGGQPYDIEHRIVVGGAIKWVREKADLEFDAHHALIGGIGITQDITERKQHEAELRHAQERFELALRGADLGGWDWDITSSRVVFTARWAELRGFALEDVAEHVSSWISGVHPEDLPQVQKTLDDYFHGRIPEYETEHRVRTKSGEWILDPRPRQGLRSERERRADPDGRDRTRHHVAQASRGCLAARRGQSVRHHLDFGRRDRRDRRGATHHAVQRRRREDLRLFEGRGDRSPARHAHPGALQRHP